MNVGAKRKQLWAIGLILLAVTLACYWPVRHFSFLNYDDDHYVSRNPIVAQGLSWVGLRWAFRSLELCNWHPLTWLSHSLDCQLYGLDAGAHHATNLWFHAANVLLVFWVLKRMTGAVWPSAFAAAVFAWHPTHVESVAWVAERKDVLSTFFFLLTLLAYTRYAETIAPDRASEVQPASVGLRRGKPESKVQGPKSKVGRGETDSGPSPHAPTLHALRWYFAALLFFALGLMSKPMLVTLPFVLLLLDYWPLNRLLLRGRGSEVRGQGAEVRNNEEPPIHHGNALVRLSSFILHPSSFLGKLPFFALAAASCVITWIAQSHGGAVAPLRDVSTATRAENVLVSYATYLVKLFWPSRLAVFYPLPPSFPFWEVAGAGVLLAMISAVVIWQVRARPWLAVGWFWFVGTLVPVIGLVQIGEQSLADRYTYIPYIGLSIAVAWGAQELAALSRRRAVAMAWLIGLCLAACLVLTRFELQFWQDSQRLFKRALMVTGDSITVHSSLASALAEQGEMEAAEQHYRRALDLMPNYALGHSDLGVALAREGKLAEAEAEFREAIRLGPQLVAAYNNLGQLLTQERKLEEAAAILQAALKLDPNNEPVHCKLGFVWALEGDLPKAADEFREGTRLAPQDADAQNMLAKILLKLSAAQAEAGRFADAVRTAEEARDRALACGDLKTTEAAARKLEEYQAHR
jgi:protein O-mannosyl-transferase